ncbi:hypothetical protein [Carnobacterium maltaromaticum]|uniref:hypothetical protein n=1 Tax=Carnobacterium maltaromaticum TaxID=2751 RepID=UPI0039B110AE
MANEVQIPLDPNPLGPMEPIFFTGTITPLSQVYANFVRSKLFGKHVREALARGILIASIDANEAKERAQIANAKSDETAERQDNLEERWDAVVSETTDGAEIIESRVDAEGVRHLSLSARLLKDFTDRLTKAQLIRFLAGEDIEVTIKSDFNTPPKIAGSIVENENIFKRNSSVGLQLPSHNTWGENSQAHYDAIKKLDDTVATFSYSSEGAVAAGGIPWNILWILEKNFPLIFKNISTTIGKVAIAKNKITYLDINAHGKGLGPNGNKFYLNAFNTTSGAWATPVNHASSAISKLTYSYHKADILLSNEGIINVAIYADATNGTTASSVSIDYANIELRVKFNISEFAVSPSKLETMRVDLQNKLDSLQTLVDTKQDKIVDSGTLYPTLGGGATSHPTIQVRYRKIGKEVKFNGRAKLPQTTLETQIGSMPLLFAPTSELFLALRVVGAQTDLSANILIKTNGTIWIYSSNNNAQYFSFDNISYFTE